MRLLHAGDGVSDPLELQIERLTCPRRNFKFISGVRLIRARAFQSCLVDARYCIVQQDLQDRPVGFRAVEDVGDRSSRDPNAGQSTIRNINRTLLLLV